MNKISSRRSGEALYIESARILKRIEEKQGSAKGLIYGSKFEDKKKLYAIVYEVLKYEEIIKEIIERSQLTRLEKINRHLALVLLYDFFLGRGIKCGGKLKFIITRHKHRLRAIFDRAMLDRQAVRKEDIVSFGSVIAGRMPRYVRVNTLKTTKARVIEHFIANGYQYIPNDLVYNSGILDITKLAKGKFTSDIHINDLLVLPPRSDLHDNQMYLNGEILLQDKASCIPAFALNPHHQSCIIDACSAPGNKTSHLASLINNTGKIYAFDISQSRLNTMRKLLDKAAVTCVDLERKNFLDINVREYEDVEYILLDPSCSGSGLIDRGDINTESEKLPHINQRRLKALANFQLRALQQALSFPSVKKVIYSTCSVNVEENEEVVEAALERFSDTYQLSPILENWPCRGISSYPHAKFMLRSSPDFSTIGFFVALFSKITDRYPDSNIYLKNKGKCPRIMLKRHFVNNKRKRRKIKLFLCSTRKNSFST